MTLKMKFTYKLLLLTFILNIFTQINCFDCDQNLGCLLKKKFFGYVSSADTRGEAHKMESNINYKNIFVFRDKIVFYKANLPQENIAEQEVQNLNPDMNEAYIERLIPFRHILLECGKYGTRICQSKLLPLIGKSAAYTTIKSKIENADDKCIAFSFIESAFDKTTEKIAVLCTTDPRQVKELLSFKNFLSRTVLKYHFQEATTRYDAKAGIEVASGHFISYINNKPTQVFASFNSKSIMMVSDNKKKDFLGDIKYLGIRNSGAYSLRVATEKKKLKDGWSDALSSPPPLDCCIVMPGILFYIFINFLLCLYNILKS